MIPGGPLLWTCVTVCLSLDRRLAAGAHVSSTSAGQLNERPRGSWPFSWSELRGSSNNHTFSSRPLARNLRLEATKGRQINERYTDQPGNDRGAALDGAAREEGGDPRTGAVRPLGPYRARLVERVCLRKRATLGPLTEVETPILLVRVSHAADTRGA